jgi:hypothetical protein
MGPDEIAVFCGGELEWSDIPERRHETNWSKRVVDDWDAFLPVALDGANPLWRRMISFYEKAAEKMDGIMLLNTPDLHTNMDLLAALRGPENLCMDLCDMPDVIDEAMRSARAVFGKIWDAVSEAGRMRKNGYCGGIYAIDGAATLQCDFSCMISTDMFRRWVLPALEEEADIVMHNVYHWDGPTALTHTDDLVASTLQVLSYVPGDGRGPCADYVWLYKKLQARGKAVEVWGSPDEVKYMHKELKPNLTTYRTWCASKPEAEALLEWFVKNT